MCVKLYNKNENQDSYYERWDLRNCFPTAIHYIPNLEGESDWETIEITLHTYFSYNQISCVTNLQ